MSSSYTAVPKVKKIMVQPINIIFRHIQNQTRVLVWLAEAKNKRFEGDIKGFDEFMDLILFNTEEINIRTNARRKLGTILLRGETIALVQTVQRKEENTEETTKQ
ncbi:hypothetical protein J6590_058176 [Homalodisca vitripennis]|nr:hypothetical protein J6590_058176 [Homalodisca vitripennis]